MSQGHLHLKTVISFSAFTVTSFGFPGGSPGQESACNVGDLGSSPEVGKIPGEANGYPLQYSGLENSMDCIDHGVTNSWTGLSYFHFLAFYVLYSMS